MKPVRTHAAIAGMLLLTSAVAGCGTASGTSARPAQLTSADRGVVPGILGRSCVFASQHDQLPSFADLTRLGTRGNIALWGSNMQAADSVIVSVRYDDEGRLAWVRAIQSSLEPGRSGPIERLLRESFNEVGPEDWGVRVRVVNGDIASVEPSIICQAEPRDGLRDGAFVPISLEERRSLSRVRGRFFPVEISISEDGRPIYVRMDPSVGEGLLHHYLMQWIYKTTFHPKMHDGIRMASTYKKTVYVPRYR